MPKFQQELDARNESCPAPLMKTKKALKGMNAGEVLHVMSTDLSSAEDIETLLRKVDASMIERNRDDDVFHMYIQKN